jgi:hypothetical protein
MGANPAMGWTVPGMAAGIGSPKEPVNDPQAMDEAPDEPPSYNPLMHQPIPAASPGANWPAIGFCCW